MLRLLNTLRFMLEQQADTLNKLCDMLPTSSVTECAELLGHPLSSLEELQEFDDKLDAGKFKILVRGLCFFFQFIELIMNIQGVKHCCFAISRMSWVFRTLLTCFMT